MSIFCSFSGYPVAIGRRLCYIESMKNTNDTRLPFSFEIRGISLKVFKTGKSLRLKNVLNSSRDPGNLKGIHSHFTYEVFFVTEGQLELVTDRDITVYERKIVIIPPKLRHYSFARTEGSFCLLFSLDRGEPANRLKAILGRGIRTLELQEDGAFYIAQAARKLEEGSSAFGSEAKLLIELLFSRILHTILPEERTADITGMTSGHMNAIEQYINSHLSQKITLADIAAHVYLSTRQVSRIIAKEWGCSLVELVTEKKLAKAEMLLKNTDMKIADISAQVNVGTSNYFYTLFKSRYGMSPLQYRKAKTAKA